MTVSGFRTILYIVVAIAFPDAHLVRRVQQKLRLELP
jgi:hypothetical protein